MPVLSNDADPHHAAGGSAAARPWWLGVGVVLIGAVWLYGGLSLPLTSRYAAVGPGMFVTMIGGALVLLGVMLLVQIAQGEEFMPQEGEDADAAAKASPRALALALAAATLPIFTIETLGLPITATLSFALVARAFGSRRTGLDLVYGAALGLASWLLFTKLGLQLGGLLPFAGY